MDFEKHIQYPSPLRELAHPLFHEKKLRVWLKEDYRTHPALSGNKFRKLKYNLIEAKAKGFRKLLTFGGAHSNHIYAVAAAGPLFGFQTEALIRGDELHNTSSPTLKFAHQQGMKLHFVSRSDYRQKDKLTASFVSDQYLIPEGGSNTLALKGCAEMWDEVLEILQPDHLILAAGTGGTAAGILSNAKSQTQVHAVPVLKGGAFIREEVEMLLGTPQRRLTLHTGFHFGGYAKTNTELSEFIEQSELLFNTELDHVYTGKMCYAAMQLIAENAFSPGQKIVLYHSGGLQGKTYLA